MPRIQTVNPAVVIMVLFMCTATAAAQCVSYDMEEFAVGQPITSHLGEAVFYVSGQSCGGTPLLYNRIQDEFYGDTFSSKVLLIDTGCPDFSDDYMTMAFYDNQGDIHFTLGPWAGSYEIRAYNTTSGGTPLEVQTIVIPGTGFQDAHYPVHITRAEWDIRRIEIEAAGSGHEAIDNLSFGQDDTPPEVRIDVPAPFECLADEAEVRGIVCDEDGNYDRDRLEYLRTWPNPQSDWTLVREFVGSQVCESGALYNWDTTEPGIVDGIYVLRVTAINACGLKASAEVTVYVDNNFDSIEFQEPESGTIVGGNICFEGTAWERTCFDHYVVRYRPAGGGSWAPVDPNHPEYDSNVTNEQFAWWTDAATLQDGDYYVVLAGYTTSGASASHQITLTLDNTPPAANIVQPAICEHLEGEVEFVGTAYDENFLQWKLQYWNPVTLRWDDIDSGTSPVVNDMLAYWDTSEMPTCYYVVRLRVWDSAIVDTCGDSWRRHADHYLAVSIGESCPGDLDGDGDVDLSDLATLLAVYGTVCD